MNTKWSVLEMPVEFKNIANRFCEPEKGQGNTAILYVFNRGERTLDPNYQELKWCKGYKTKMI